MKNWYTTSALVLLAVLFLAVTLINTQLFKGLRLDLTENQLYTLSEGTSSLLESLEEPITLHFFFSEETSSDLPTVRNFARRVDELLTEMSQTAGDELRIRRVDPEPFSEAEDEAARFGLQAVPLGQSGDSLYLGVAGTNSLDGVEVIEFLQPNREQFLEYELAQMIYTLSQPEPPRVGLVSGLPMTGGMDPRSGQRRPPWVIHDKMNEMFEVVDVSPGASELPGDLDVVVLVHPKGLSEDLRYALDQFALQGGRVLAFVDPHAEADPGPNPGDPMAAMNADRTSGLPELFAAWGIKYDASQFVGDLGQAMQVSVQGGQAARHPGVIGVTGEAIDAGDVVTAELDTVNLSSAGHFGLAEDSPLTLDTLLASSRRAMLMDTERLRMLRNPESLLDDFSADGTAYTLAARLSGEVASAFPDRSGGEHVAGGEINAIVVADTDMLTDRFWVQRQNFFGSSVHNPFANNGDFVINAIDNLLGNADLISVRSRATSARPFTRVEALRQQAEADLRATEQRLEAELQETEQRLTEIQQGRGDSELSVLTPEQEAEVDRFMQKRLEIRQQLRQVRRDLDEEIEALGTRLKLVNIGLVPLLVVVFALLLAWRRRNRHKEGLS